MERLDRKQIPRYQTRICSTSEPPVWERHGVTLSCLIFFSLLTALFFKGMHSCYSKVWGIGKTWCSDKEERHLPGMFPWSQDLQRPLCTGRAALLSGMGFSFPEQDVICSDL